MRPMPHPNCYWVVSGKLMAGEYPGDLKADAARAKIGALLDAGINCFVDLTEHEELIPYEPLLREEAGKRRAEVVHHRISIRDQEVPASAEVMHRILDTIDAAMAEGQVVYVHCWGGIGRTGTVVGCHLVRNGLGGEEALAKVLELYRATMAKRHRRPQAPETGPQCEWVRNWHKHAAVRR